MDELCTLTDSPIGFFHFVEPDQRTLSLQSWSTRTKAEFCTAEGQGQHYSVDQAGVWVDCVREGRPVIHNDYASLTHKKGLPDGHAPVTREMVFPIIRDQKIVAIMGVGNKPVEYTESDLTYASRLADLIWDITARKQAEEKIRAALAEKELLLRELNHRTKNNLNIVSSLVNLQASMNDNQEFTALAETLESRIQSISLVHEMLYQSPNLAQIDLANYAHKLAVNLMSGLAVSSEQVVIEIDAEPVFVGINTAIPCGQILNELIVNAYKYAFPNGRRGKLTILLRQNNASGEVTLCVKDDGVGLPPGFDINRLNSLGMTIVQTLTSQLHGSLFIEAQNGTSWEIRFIDKSGFPK
jgi:two-component sensor histidine kinase